MNNIERPIVTKFGGSSLADAQRIRNAAEIVYGDSDRRYVVVSAPGKRDNKDEKITDLLLRCSSLVEEGLSFDQSFEQVSSRFENIGRELECYSVFTWLNDVHKGIKEKKGKDWIVSRGEWLMAKVFADFLHGSFVDASQLIRLKQNGQIDSLTYEIVKKQLAKDSVYYIVPGFYGSDRSGSIKIFARGGSDITGAIIARGIGARIYENWTDTNGVRAADPKIITDPKVINEMTYAEMRELGYRGADVLQKDAVLPVVEIGIPINIRNSFNPSYHGTMIAGKRTLSESETVIGISGRSGFIAFEIVKFGMNDEKGVGRKVLEIFEKNNIRFEHDPTGLDTMSVIVSKDQIDGKGKRVTDEITRTIKPDKVEVLNNLGLVCVVGQGIKRDAAGVQSALFRSLKEAGIEIKLTSMGTTASNIVVGVDGDKVNQAIKTLYNAFIV